MNRRLTLHLSLFLALLFTSSHYKSQNSNSKWFFGNFAALNFLNTPPLPVNGSTMNAVEGCNAIADPSGNLLFYTNNIFVWNANNQVMANGSGINGLSSNTQTGLIVKKPGSNTIYYLVTTTNTQAINPAFNHDLSYSIIDMSLATGMGSVTVKNATLSLNPYAEQVTEKIHGVKHCNGVDTWILAHTLNSKTFRSYLVSAAGISTVPVVSNVGQDTISLAGSIKLSPTGEKLALIGKGFNSVIVHDFDNNTGIVSSNSLVLPGVFGGYGLEFSPDGSKLYMSAGLTSSVALWQWDLCAGSNSAVIASKTLIHSEPNVISGGALQLAIDGKIYRSRFNKDTLGVINNPNAAGTNCNYVNSGLSLGGKTCNWGLPNQIMEIKRSVVVTQSVSCQKVSFSYSINNLACSNYSISNKWVFGDPLSGSQNTSTAGASVHNYSGVGPFAAQLIIYYRCGSDTVNVPVNIASLSPTIAVIGDTSLCKGEKTTLQISGNGVYSWSTGQFSSTLSVQPLTNTSYTVTVTNALGCKTSAKINIIVNNCTAFDQLEENTRIRIFPNPTSFDLTIDSKFMISNLALRDCLGRVVKEGCVNANKIVWNIAELEKGIYYLELQTEAQSRQYIINKE